MFKYGLVLLGLALVPSTALAVEVECSNEDGTCTVSNDGGTDSVNCDCDGVSSGTTGGNVWAGLDEDEMNEVCLGELELCGGFGTTFGGTTFGEDTGVFTDSATTTPATSFGVTTDNDTSDSATTDGFTTSGKGTEGPDSDSTSTGGFELTSSGGEPDTTGGPIDPTDTTGGPVDPSESETNNNGESGNGEEGGQSETTTDESGCGCRASGPESGWAMALGLFGLLGLRRRKR